jgi:hypothetical protein
MRTRELVKQLRSIQRTPNPIGWFPSRQEVQTRIGPEVERLIKLDKLLPEIIEKLTKATP